MPWDAAPAALSKGGGVYSLKAWVRISPSQEHCIRSHPEEKSGPKRTRPMYSSACISRERFLLLLSISFSLSNSYTCLINHPPCSCLHRQQRSKHKKRKKKHSQSSPSNINSHYNKHVSHQAYRDPEAVTRACRQHQHALSVRQLSVEYISTLERISQAKWYQAWD